GRFAANEMQAVVAATLAGFGIAQLPHSIAEPLINGQRLSRVLRDYTTPVGGLHVLYPSSRHLSPLVKAFIELASDRISSRANTAADQQ
ncbi:MAG: LysR family transcriptional regulator, partial [Mesorhizobium sp.]